MSTELQKAKELYKTATPAARKIIQEIFPGESFTDKITDRCKTFEEACAICPPSAGLQAIFDYSGDDEELQFTRDNAKRNYFAKVLKEGALLDFANRSQDKWFCIFIYDKAKSGFV